jgi:hypothetical protein
MYPEQQMNQIVTSVRAFGFVNPILADPDGRLMAAKATWPSPKSDRYIRGLSETQKRALRIADN